MSKEEIVFDEHLLKISKWEKFKLWLWQRRNRKQISIWVSKGDKKC